jgi:hypothetical protein
MNSQPALRNSVSRTVTGSSAKFTDALVVGRTYRIVGDVDLWFKLAATGGSVTASEAGAIFLPAGRVEFDTVTDADATYLHVIRAAAVSGNVNVSVVNGGI